MDRIVELMERWAELEPDRCRREQHKHGLMGYDVIEVLVGTHFVKVVHGGMLLKNDWARAFIEYAIKQGCQDHDADFRYEHAFMGTPVVNVCSLGGTYGSRDKNSTIAALEAYTEFLEHGNG